GAWKAKQFEFAEPHFVAPRSVSVPSRFPSTTSPVRSSLTSAKYRSTGPATMAMSPVKAKRTTGAGAAGVGVEPASASTAASRKRPLLTARQGSSELGFRLRVRCVGELAELACDEVRRL